MLLYSYIGYLQVIFGALPSGWMYYNRFRDVLPNTQGYSNFITQHMIGVHNVDLPFVIARNLTLASSTNPEDPHGLSEQVRRHHTPVFMDSGLLMP